MPWKGEKDPYKIWLSEIILQQTRVEQGLNYYKNFIEAFPDIKKLAAADEKKIFKLWEGLGYYSRCRHLIATARHISNTKNGVFPKNYDEILALPGVGPYTAAAIGSFAFNLPHAVIDGNVLRVLARVFGIETPVDATEGKKLFTQLANDLLPQKTPGIYNQAIMDFGATICKPVAPSCSTCVFKNDCVAYANNIVNRLPVKKKKVQIKQRHFYFFIIKSRGSIALRERTEKDIWRHLYEFPLIETDHPISLYEVAMLGINKGWVEKKADIKSMSLELKQKLTHQIIKGVFVIVNANKRPSALKKYEWVNEKELAKFAFPRLINDFMRTSPLFD